MIQRSQMIKPGALGGGGGEIETGGGLSTVFTLNWLFRARGREGKGEERRGGSCIGDKEFVACRIYDQYHTHR